jgi:cell division protein FtsW (lipid II flippase)
MKINDLFYRRVLLVCAVLFVIVGLVVALGVIPPVKADTYPGVKHDIAAAAFWINIGLNLLSAFFLFFISFRAKERNWKSTSVLIITGLLVLILGLAFVDAASAYQKHGPLMQLASKFLLICAAVDLLCGIAVITTALLRPKTG